MRKFNSTALDAEDAWFSKPHYAAALAQFCKANGITAEQVAGGKGIGAAREYAIREAQKATYRDTNAFSQMISISADTAGDNKMKRLENPHRRNPACSARHQPTFWCAAWNTALLVSSKHKL